MEIPRALQRWGLPRTAVVARALGRLAPAEADPSVPRLRPDGSVEFSLRLSVLLADALELAGGHVVALPLPRPARFLQILEAADARPFDPIRDRRADRSLEFGPVFRPVPLARDGFSLRLSLEPYEESLRKRIPAGKETAEIPLGSIRLADRPAPGPGGAERTVRSLLVLESFSRRAVAGDVRTRHDHLFADAVESTWDPIAGRSSAVSAEARGHLEEARRRFYLAYIHQFSGDAETAAELYRSSLARFPTAEAHTFLGWALSRGGDYVGAIEACKEAVRLDPDFGNPYNDIGAYLLELGRPEEALSWIDRATRAPRYDARHFAYCNAGRGLLQLNRREEAIAAFRRALEIDPEYRPAQEYLRRLTEASSRPKE